MQNCVAFHMTSLPSHPERKFFNFMYVIFVYATRDTKLHDGFAYKSGGRLNNSSFENET
jgi:hypothetical protein